MHRPPDMSLWQREPDGSYAAQMNGFNLHVRWRPESAHSRHGFSFSGDGPLGRKIESREIFEEIEVAMQVGIRAAMR